MGRWTKFAPLKRIRTPRQKRQIPTAGLGDDRGRFYKCWNCGYPAIDSWKKEVGDGSGNQVEEFVPRSYIIQNATISAFYDQLSGTDLLAPRNLSGYSVLSYSTAGCPFCGIKNWR